MATTATKLRPRTRLLTAEQYSRLEPYVPSELVRGKVIPVPPAFSIHGFVCANTVFLLRSHVEQYGLGTVFCNDSGVVTEHDPDTVRGADVAFYGKNKDLTKYLRTRGYIPFPPDLVVEVKSADQPWREILEKVAEYLNAGTPFVVVLDYVRRTATIYEADNPERALKDSEYLELPAVLPKLKVKVAKFFD